MNRRAFFGAMTGGIATAAAVRTWPFRVFSFPTNIVLAKASDIVEAPMVAYRMPGLRIPLLVPMLNPPTYCDQIEVLSYPYTRWVCRTVWNDAELEDLIAECRATQGPDWESMVRASSLRARMTE